MNRPTLHDVALEAGVSHMTVSRVLHGVHAVRKETAGRVRAAVAKLGYRPDPALSALAAYRTKGGGRGSGGVLAFVDCDGTGHSRSVFEGAREEASLLGYACESIRLPSGEHGQARLSRMLFHRGVQGLLFGPSGTRQEFKGWDWPRFAAVSLGALCHRPAMHTVSLDYFHGAASACERLFGSGRKRLALVVNPALQSRTGDLWLGGYAAGVLARHAPLVFAKNPIDDRAQVRRWFSKERIDGVLTIHGELAGMLDESGLAAAYLNEEGEGLPFAHYHLPNPDIGREGVRLLHHALLRREFGLPAEPKHVALRGVWRTHHAAVSP